MGYKKITFGIPSVIFLMVLVLLLGMNLLLIIQSLIENSKFGSYGYSAITFVLLIVMIFKSNLRSQKSP